MSGQIATADILKRARTHGYDFELLVKPVSTTELLVRVANLIDASEVHLKNAMPKRQSGMD